MLKKTVSEDMDMIFMDTAHFVMATYKDFTEKYIEVVLKGFEKFVDGKKDKMWDVLLSDIGVTNTNF